jgi:hypothetical protein
LISSRRLSGWLALATICCAIVAAVYSLGPFTVGSLGAKIGTPILFPGLLLSVLVSGSYHSDPIPGLVILGAGLTWAVVGAAGLLIYRRVKAH